MPAARIGVIFGGVVRKLARGPRIPRPLLLVGGLLLCCLSPRRAAACACCDGRSGLELLGGSPDGRELLLRHEELAGCERHVRLEVYRAGTVDPSRCFDLLGDPDQAVSCDATRAGFQDPATSGRTRDFPRSLRSLSPRGLAASTSVATDDDFRRATVEVHWLGTAAPRRLASLAVHEYSYWSPEDGALAELAPIEVTVVLPGQDAEKAALLVTGVDTMPGIGHRGWLLRWIDLPAGLTAEAGVHWVRAVDDFGSPPHPEAAESRRLNTLGVRALSANELAAARAHFEQALAFDPGHVLARYNLACALARLGLPRHAWHQLEPVLTRPPPAVRTERRARALVDPDLTSLRHLPEFRALVGEVPTTTPVPSAAGSVAPGVASPRPPPSGGSPAAAPSVRPTALTGVRRPPSCGCRVGARPASTGSLPWLLGALVGAAWRRRESSRRRQAACSPGPAVAASPPCSRKTSRSACSPR